MQSRGNSISTVLAIALALLCQFVMACFAAEALATSPTSPLREVSEERPQQLSMVGGTLPVLLEGKRIDRLAKRHPTPQQLSNGFKVGIRLSLLQPEPRMWWTNSAFRSVRRGYWLIYRSLLL